MTLVIQINAAVIAMYYLHYPREACWMHIKQRGSDTYPVFVIIQLFGYKIWYT